jgi:hypothetical protein
MENRIKECQFDLYADRTSSATMRANQLRLWFASIAYLLIRALRRIDLGRLQLADRKPRFANYRPLSVDPTRRTSNASARGLGGVRSPGAVRQ